MSFRIGNVIDFHQLREGREFWLGGIRIPGSKGALGHSDADVLIHAICDALLGALNLGDIGMHFPDTDPAYKDIDSKKLLQQVFSLVKKKRYHVVNLDSTICLQAPRIEAHTGDMRRIIADLLETAVDNISIKATTTEHMGFVGRGEGIAAYATVLLEQIPH